MNIEDLLTVERPYKYNLKLNKKYIRDIDSDIFSIICSAFNSTLISTLEKDDVVYELEELKEI